MRKLFIVVSIFLVSLSAFAFPLKELKEGDKVDMKKFVYPNNNYTDKEDKAPLKVLLLWRGDKRLSIRTFNEFKQFCEKNDVVCVAVEIGVKEKLEPAKNIIYAYDDAKITDSWGIFTLPVTLVLDQENKAVFGIGFEGQYRNKLEKIIELKQGKVTEEEYNRITNVQGVDKSVSKLPEINFAKGLVKKGNISEAQSRLSTINPADLNDNEKAKYAEALVMIKEYESALGVLQTIQLNTPEIRFIKGYTSLELAELDDALTELEAIKDIYPKKERVFCALGRIYYEKGNYKESADYYKECCEKVIDF